MKSDRARRLLLRAGPAALILPLLMVLSPASAAQSLTGGAGARQSVEAGRSAATETAVWTWPTASHHVVVPYLAPTTAYGPGHRGIDISARSGVAVTAPAAGVVAFVGRVADRSVLAIAHGDGLVSTLEPVVSDLADGAAVRAGDRVGIVAQGGHAAADTVHLGARRDGEYMNPLLLLGGIPRAVLLPCCS